MSAALLLLATLSVAEKSPLLGLTREQLLDREGEPKSQIVAGGREVIFFARERVVWRSGGGRFVARRSGWCAARRPRRPWSNPASPSSAAPSGQAPYQPTPALAANNSPDELIGQTPAAGGDPASQPIVTPPPEPQLSDQVGSSNVRGCQPSRAQAGAGPESGAGGRVADAGAAGARLTLRFPPRTMTRPRNPRRAGNRARSRSSPNRWRASSRCKPM